MPRAVVARAVAIRAATSAVPLESEPRRAVTSGTALSIGLAAKVEESLNVEQHLASLTISRSTWATPSSLELWVEPPFGWRHFLGCGLPAVSGVGVVRGVLCVVGDLLYRSPPAFDRGAEAKTSTAGYVVDWYVTTLDRVLVASWASWGSWHGARFFGLLSSVLPT